MLKRTAVLLAVATAWTAWCSPSFAQTFSGDDFELGTPGVFANCPWLDVGLVNPDPPNPPIPSATVESVTGSDGDPTLALKTVAAIAQTQGAYALVPVSSVYIVSGDVRVDQFSDNSLFPADDWAMQIGVGKLVGEKDLAFTPQVGIYASALTQGWRLYADGNLDAFADVDLGASVQLGVWYHVEMTLTVATGQVHSLVQNLATREVVVDRTDTVPDWTPQDGVYDRIMLLDGEISPAVTIPNLAVVDNVAIATQPADPPGPQGDLDGDGDVDGFDLALLLGQWTGAT